MKNERFDIVVVGAGHGGAQAAMALRQRKFAGSIALLGDEPDLPYERPPLSKEFLSGDKPFERILIRPPAFWSERDIVVRGGHRVVAVDPDARSVQTADGGTLDYGTLIWAAGGSPRRLTCQGHHLAGIHAIRTRRDVDALRSELAAAKRVAVVGGGYIGLEAAAVLSKSGVQVVVLEAQDRVLARVAGHDLSTFYQAEHRAHGVEIRLGCTVACIEEHDGRACGVRLDAGEIVACDLVIVGIGIVPSIDPLSAAGAAGGNGVAVDEFCRTSLPDVFAIGDCALHRNRFADDAVIRLESVQNANDMATTVATALTGTPLPYAATPWFWSNQFDLKLQTVGLSLGHDETVLRGDPATRSFSVVYLRDGKVIALDCVNRTKDFVGGRKLVEAGERPSIARLGDIDVPLQSLTMTTGQAAAVS